MLEKDEQEPLGKGHTEHQDHVWHVDGYDKLKPYGFPVHGCIDGV